MLNHLFYNPLIILKQIVLRWYINVLFLQKIILNFYILKLFSLILKMLLIWQYFLFSLYLHSWMIVAAFPDNAESVNQRMFVDIFVDFNTICAKSVFCVEIWLYTRGNLKIRRGSLKETLELPSREKISQSVFYKISGYGCDALSLIMPALSKGENNRWRLVYQEPYCTPLIL